MLPLIRLFLTTTGWASPSKAKNAPPAMAAPVWLVTEMLLPITAALVTVAGVSISTAFPANDPSPPTVEVRLPLMRVSFSTSV